MTLIFWTLNVPATLTVGYTYRGETIMRPRLSQLDGGVCWVMFELWDSANAININTLAADGSICSACIDTWGWVESQP